VFFTRLQNDKSIKFGQYQNHMQTGVEAVTGLLPELSLLCANASKGTRFTEWLLLLPVHELNK